MPDLISHPEVDQQILQIPGQARNDIRNTEFVMPDLISFDQQILRIPGQARNDIRNTEFVMPDLIRHPEVDQQILWIPGQARNDIRNTEIVKSGIQKFQQILRIPASQE